MQPHQIISLMDMGGPTMVARRPRGPHPRRLPAAVRARTRGSGGWPRGVLSSNQWDRFVSRLTDIENPVVRTTPSKYSIKVRKRKRASDAHVGRVAPATAPPGSSSRSASSTSRSRSGRRRPLPGAAAATEARRGDGASRRRRRKPGGRAAGVAAPDADHGRAPAEPVSVTRVTVIGARRVRGRGRGADWLDGAAGASSRRSEEVALRCALNRGPARPPDRRRTIRTSARSSRGQARRVRLGYGTGDELVEGALARGLRRSRPAAHAGAAADARARGASWPGILGGRRPGALRARTCCCARGSTSRTGAWPRRRSQAAAAPPRR